jgi:hypothetical protein
MAAIAALVSVAMYGVGCSDFRRVSGTTMCS